MAFSHQTSGYGINLTFGTSCGVRTHIFIFGFANSVTSTVFCGILKLMICKF